MAAPAPSGRRVTGGPLGSSAVTAPPPTPSVGHVDRRHLPGRLARGPGHRPKHRPPCDRGAHGPLASRGQLLASIIRELLRDEHVDDTVFTIVLTMWFHESDQPMTMSDVERLMVVSQGASRALVRAERDGLVRKTPTRRRSLDVRRAHRQGTRPCRFGGLGVGGGDRPEAGSPDASDTMVLVRPPDGGERWTRPTEAANRGRGRLGGRPRPSLVVPGQRAPSSRCSRHGMPPRAER